MTYGVNASSSKRFLGDSERTVSLQIEFIHSFLSSIYPTEMYPKIDEGHHEVLVMVKK